MQAFRRTTTGSPITPIGDRRNSPSDDLQTARKFTYSDVDRRTAQLTAALAQLGIAKGDRVALLAPNCAEYFELQFACGRLGAIMLR